MAKIDKSVTIADSELIEYLDKSSDFAFELKCLELLSKLGFDCQHGGSYTDSVTGKTRQFDIRAQKSHKNLRVRCAIECKNISKSFPLLVMCIPRAENESFHELILSYDPDYSPATGSGWNAVPALREKCKTLRGESPYSAYVPGEPVGKSCAQVGRTIPNQNRTDVIAKDDEVFEKWSQALASANDLADDATAEGEECKDHFLSLILPVLVVPDGMLWEVDYESNGTRKGDPIKTDRCSFYVAQYYSAGDKMFGTSLTVSHLEFVTLTGLDQLMKDIEVPNNAWFPIDHLFKIPDEIED